MSEWAYDASREEVPTLSNNVLLSQAAGERCAWSLAVTSLDAILKGTGLPAGVLVPASAGDVFTAARPKPHEAAQITVQQIIGEKYQNMTRVAANGGDQSGSHPAWDPV
jgi:hypothetical protein